MTNQFDTRDKCKKYILDTIYQLFTDISVICEENRERFGEEKVNWYDMFLSNGQKIIIARDSIMNSPFEEIIENYRLYVLPYSDKIKQRDIRFFTDKKNVGIYASLKDPEAVEFFRRLWVIDEDEGGFEDDHKEAIWENVSFIVFLVSRWLELDE